MEDIQKKLGKNLVTLIEYYNGDEKNILAICNTLDIDTLKRLKQLKKTPLVMTKEEFISGVDVFPIEFLNIKQNHRVIYGEDFLHNIKISKKSLHHQLEFELRSKLIHLREEYLYFKGKDLENLILSSIPALTPLIGALLYLVDIYSNNKIDIFKAVSDAYKIDTGILKEISDIRYGNAKFNKDKEIYIRDIIKIMAGLGRIVDELKVE